MLVETAAEASVLVTAAGFAQVTNSPQTTGTAAAVSAVALQVFWKRATSTAEANVTLADAGDHVYARIITFTNVVTSGNPWDITAGNVKAASTTNVSVTGATTTTPNCLIVVVVANGTDTATAQASTWTNVGLSGFAEIIDSNDATGTGGGLSAATGGLAVAGAIGTSTVTLATAGKNAYMVIALKPDVTTGTGSVAVRVPVLAGTGTQSLLPRVDSFTAGAGVLDSTWTQQRTAGTVNYDGSGSAQASAPDVDAFAFDNLNAYPANQYAKLTIGGGLSAGIDFVGVLTRASLSGDANYKNYCFYTDGTSGAGHTAFGIITADVLTELTSFATTFTGGDVMELRSIGTLHECFKNGVSLGTFTDATHTSGSAGLEIHNSSGGGTPTVGTWEGGAAATAITGTGSIALPVPSLAGSGFRGLLGVGALAVALVLGGTGQQTQSGSGSIAVAPSLSGTGTVTQVGTGSVAIPVPSLSGTGSTTSAGVTGTGSIALPIPTLAGTGQQTQSGSGSLAVPIPALSGTGGQAQAATGSIAVPVPSLAGTGKQTQSGSGSVAVPVPSLSGTGNQAQSGTGSVAVALAISGTGTSGSSVSGSGSLALPVPSLAGAGQQTQAGTGSLAVAPPSLSGVGSVTQPGSGSIAVTLQVSGTGTVVSNTTGTGSLAVLLGVSGTGTNTPIAVTLTGKYRPEHDSALVDVSGATGFAKEHTDALADVGNATGFSNEHTSVLKDVGDAGV